MRHHLSVWSLLAAVVGMPAVATVAAADTIPRYVDKTEYVDKTGFALEQPEPEAARNGAYDRTTLTIYSPRLVFWVDAIGLTQGDRLVLSLRGPDRSIMAERNIKLDLWPKSFFAFAGANRPPLGWKRGAYTGQVEILRGDLILEAQTIQIALP